MLEHLDAIHHGHLDIAVITSNFSAGNKASASAPERAPTGWHPSRCKRRVRTSRFSPSSSTISILPPVSEGPAAGPPVVELSEWRSSHQETLFLLPQGAWTKLLRPSTQPTRQTVPQKSSLRLAPAHTVLVPQIRRRNLHSTAHTTELFRSQFALDAITACRSNTVGSQCATLADSTARRLTHNSLHRESESVPPLNRRKGSQRRASQSQRSRE